MGGERSLNELLCNRSARLCRVAGMALRAAALFSVFLVIWVFGMQQRAGKETIIKPIQYIGHSDEAGYASGGRSLAAGRGLTVPYVSYFFNPYQPWGHGGDGGAGVYRREDHWPPFMGFAIAPCVYFLGDAPWIYKLPAIFFGSVGLPLTTALLAYALSRRGYVAIAAALITILNPTYYTESLKTLSDISTGMLVAGFAGSVVLAQRRPWMHIVAGAFLAGAYFAKGSQLVLLGVYPVMALLCTGPRVFLHKSFWAGIATALFLMAPYWYGNWKTYGYAFQSTQNYVSGWYAVDNDWELRAYYPYWGVDLPRTSDLWTKPAYREEYWSNTQERRLSYMAAALGGSAVWSDAGPLGVWWRTVISRAWNGPKSGPNAANATLKTPFAWPEIKPLFSWKTFNMPLIVSRVELPVISDAFRRWAAKAAPTAAPTGASPAPAAAPQRGTLAAVAPMPVVRWPFAELAGVGVISVVSLAVIGLPVVMAAGLLHWSWRFWFRKRKKADRTRTPPPPLRAAWFPGPVLAVAFLLVVEVGFIAYLWAVWEPRFYFPFMPLALGFGCAAYSLIFEAPIRLLLSALRGAFTAALLKSKQGPAARGWIRAAFAFAGHWHVVLTLIVALALLYKQPQVSAIIEKQAHPANAGGYPYTDEDEYPDMGKWIAAHLPNAVIMCRNPWELLFYCGPNNRGIGLVNPGGAGAAATDKILAIANYYHVTHMYADNVRPAMSQYMSQHPDAFHRVPGAPGTIWEIDWSKIKVKTPAEVTGIPAGE